MNEQIELKTGEELMTALVGMPIPRPFGLGRMVLAEGATGWFLSILLIPANILAVLMLLNKTGLEGIASKAFLVILVYLLYRLAARGVKPFGKLGLLRRGELRVVPITGHRQETGNFDKIAVRIRTTYGFRFSEGGEKPVLTQSFDGAHAYPGGESLVMYRGGSEHPKRFFALNPFLFHKGLTILDLLREDARENARIALGFGQEVKPRLGPTAAHLVTRFFVALLLLAGIVGLVLYVASV